MAIIKCRECGKEMSDHAERCTNCGVENSIIFCPECDKQLSSKAIMCPSCGCPVGKSTMNNDTNSSINGLCLGGMITGICSFLIDLYGLVSLTGLVISIVGLTRSTGRNRIFAIVGIICSGIELILKVIYVG